MALVTINPAKQLRIEDRVGSIEVGKDADLVIYNKHPLSVYAVVDKTIIDGIVYFDRAEDLAGRPELAKEKETLLEKQEEQQKKKKADSEGSRPTPEEVSR